MLKLNVDAKQIACLCHIFYVYSLVVITVLGEEKCVHFILLTPEEIYVGCATKVNTSIDYQRRFLLDPYMRVHART